MKGGIMEHAKRLIKSAQEELLFRSDSAEQMERDELAIEYKILALNALYSAMSYIRLAEKHFKQ